MESVCLDLRCYLIFHTSNSSRAKHSEAVSPPPPSRGMCRSACSPLFLIQSSSHFCKGTWKSWSWTLRCSQTLKESSDRFATGPLLG